MGTRAGAENTRVNRTDMVLTLTLPMACPYLVWETDCLISNYHEPEGSEDSRIRGL